MADSIRKADYFVVKVPNTAGQGARLLGALRDASVDLVAFTGFPAAGGAQVDFVPANSAAFRVAARKLKLKISQRKTVFVVRGSDRVGAIARICEKLAAAKINMVAMDAVTAGGGRYGAIFWVKPDKVARAAKVLGAR